MWSDDSYKSLINRFFKNERWTESDAKIERSLLAKTLIIHCFNSLIRIYQVATSSGAWLEDKVMCEDLEQCSSKCIIKYNKDLIDPIKDKLESFLMLMIILAAFVDAFAIKYRKLAHLLPYMEIITRLTASMIPNLAS